MLDRFEIPFAHWSMKVGRVDPTGVAGALVAPDVYGEIVSGIDDLHQSIANLILTPKGSVPTNPEKGCDLFPFIDRHPDIGIPNMTRAIWDAIAIWEPRVVTEEVNVDQLEFAHFACKVFWRPIESVLDDLQQTVVKYGSEAATNG